MQRYTSLTSQRRITCLMAIFLGWLGIHKLVLRKPLGCGIHIVLLITGAILSMNYHSNWPLTVPFIIPLLEALGYALMSNETFQRHSLNSSRVFL